MKVRYIKDSHQGSSMNVWCQWVEIRAIDVSGTNVALNKLVTHSFKTPNDGNASLVTDGDTDDANRLGYSNAENQVQHVIIDLGKEYDIIQIQKYHRADGRIYKNMKTEVSLNSATWTTVFDSNVDGEYSSTPGGKFINLKMSSDSDLTAITKTMELCYLELNKQKDVLKSKLAEKGVEVSDSDSISNLIENLELVQQICPGASFELARVMSNYTLPSSTLFADVFSFSCGFDGTFKVTGSVYLSSGGANKEFIINIKDKFGNLKHEETHIIPYISPSQNVDFNSTYKVSSTDIVTIKFKPLGSGTLHEGFKVCCDFL